MSADPLVVTEPLGGSPLSRAARAGQLPQWYPAVPQGADWVRHAATVRGSVDSGWYDSLRDAIAPTGAAGSRLERAAREGIVVTTGQQPGLFGGPLMTLIKAITARAVADSIERAAGIPVAPVFWAATDDADFDEAAVVSVALDGGARELRVERAAPAGTPMSRVPLSGRDLDALGALLREACGSAAHVSYLDMVLRAYRDGVTVGDAYVSLLRHVLEPLGIAVLDASHPAVARAAEPVLRRASSRAEAVSAALSDRNAAIAAAGFEPQVEEVAGLSLVFLNTRDGKRRVPIRDATTLTVGSEEFLSSTVLLRPVVERSILPTAAYVGGPAEVAYFAQVSAVAAAIETPVPVVVPRWSATIIEPRVRAVLDEFDIAAEALADPHAVETRVAKAHLPADATQALAAMRADVAANLDRLRMNAQALVEDSVLEGLRRNVGHRVDRLERRLVAAVKRRETDIMRRLGTARGSLFPFGVKQERKLGYVPFLARYGPLLVEQMLGRAREHARGIVGAPVEEQATVSTR